MAKGKSTKDKRPDFLRDNKSDQADNITVKDVWLAITLRHDPARKVVGFMLLALSLVMFISFISFYITWNLDQSLLATND